MTEAGGVNLVEDPSGASGLGGSDLTGLDPLLGPLADNGGPTETHRPLPTSPAIDAGAATGNTPATDQRWLPRQVGILDIGSVEVE